jgi:type III restriction enzyme
VSREFAGRKCAKPGFEIGYVVQGIVKKYRPDYLIRLAHGATLVFEVKGRDSQESKTKREFLDEWVKAVNAHGGFGRWAWDVLFNPKDVAGILREGMSDPQTHGT